jgi:hypothetical protein
MSLADELEAENQAHVKNRCRICHWLTEVSDADSTAYRQWVAADKSKSILYRACTRIDPPVPGAYSTFSRHVRECVNVAAR